MPALSTILCVLAAVLYWTFSALSIYLNVQKGAVWAKANADTYKMLVPENIEYEWALKERARGIEFTIGFLNAVFWIVFCIPVIEMAWILSRNGTRSLPTNFGIVLFAMAASWTKWFSNIFWNGMYVSMTLLAKRFNLDNWMPEIQDLQYQLEDEDGVGWRCLELNYIVSKGLVWLVNGVEWIFLSAIFVLTFLSVREWRQFDQASFGGKWNALGLFIGLLCLIEFITEIVGFMGYKLAWVFVVLYAGLTKLILIPTWILILGFQLPNATSKEFDTSVMAGTGELELAEERQQRPAAFTIDDDQNENEDDDMVDVGPASPPAEAFTAVSSLTDSPQRQSTE